MPKKVKKSRKIEAEDGTEAGWEEYFDYIFPSDEVAQPNLKLLALAKQWKTQKQGIPVDEEASSETSIISPDTDEVDNLQPTSTDNDV